MTPLYDTQEFYKKMLELQDRLRKSEDERMKLEERFNLLSQDSRSRREACINNLRMRYIDFLEEQRLRDERNHQILGTLDKIDGSLARMTARTDRLGILRKQYEAYLLRVYANRSAGGGTGDSGVGSHNDDRSPKTNILQIEKSLPSTHREVTQNVGNPSSFIPQTHYPQSYIGASNISQFNVPKYIPGQETPQVHVTQAHGHGDGSTIVQPDRIPQNFYGSQNLNIPNTSASKTQLMPNSSQEFISPLRNYPQNFSANTLSRSDFQFAPNTPQVQHQQLRDIPNQYPPDPRSYAADSSTMRSRNLPDSQDILSSDLQSFPGLQTDGRNPRAVPDYSADFTGAGFGPYRHSTPLPGYLDYSTRYSRDPPMHEPNTALRYGFTRSDLEKVISRNEPILPRDYLHNPETVKSTVNASKLSSLPEDKKRASDAKPSRGMNDDDLDQYINRIRSLHRDNDQSLEAFDVEQNTSGDLLNATLSDDGPEQFTLHSDDKVKPNKTKIFSDDATGVFALEDDFVGKTRTLGDESKFSNDRLIDRNIPLKSVFPPICNEDAVAKATFAKSSDASPAVLNADMTSDNLSISATRDDILSGTASVDVNQIPDTFANANVKFRPKITPQIADIATVAGNSAVGQNQLPPNERGSNQLPSSSSQEYLKMLEKRSNPDKEVIIEDRKPTQVLSSIESMATDHGFVPKKTEVHEDIEGDKVRLIEGEQMPEQVIDVVRELQPPSLQHYEKKVLEIRVGDEDRKKANIRKVLPDGPQVHGNEETAEINPGAVNVAETLPQDFIAEKIHTEYDITDQKYSGVAEIVEQSLKGSKQKTTEDLQYQDDAGQKHEVNPGHEYRTNEHQLGQNLAQDVNESRNTSQEFEQNSEQLHGPNGRVDYDTRQTSDETNQLEQPYVSTSDEPYDSNQVHDANEHYETDPNQQYAQESNPQYDYNSNQHVEGDIDGQYATEPNEHYGTDPNEQYTPDPNEQYAANPNEQYASDQNEQYVASSNEQYVTNPDEQYLTDPNEQYTTNPTEQYVTDPNEQYTTNPTEQYVTDPNEQYATNPTEQYSTGLDEHYAIDPNEQYTADPNEQYGYYQDQPYQNDPNAAYENTGNEQYEYSADQDYQHDPNQQYEHDPNQQYEHDPSQPYEHDPNQQYQHDPNESSAQDPNQEYREGEYEQNQSYEPVGYEEPGQGGNQQFGDDARENYTGDNPETQSSDQDHPTSTAEANMIEEQNVTQAAGGDSYVEESSDPNGIGAKEYSADGKKKDKDVIRALLESDTDSTIERNPSNNTESDFDFN